MIFKIYIPTSWYPHAVGQTKKINFILNMYMRSFCQRDQQDKPTILPLDDLYYSTTIKIIT